MQKSFQYYYYCVLSCSIMPNFLKPHGLEPTRLLCPWGFSRQEYWSGLPCPPPGDLSKPEMEPRWILYCLNHQGSPIATQSILFYPIIVAQATIFITILPLQKTIRCRLLPTMKMRIPKFQSRQSDLRVQLLFYFCQTHRTK